MFLLRLFFLFFFPGFGRIWIRFLFLLMILIPLLFLILSFFPCTYNISSFVYITPRCEHSPALPTDLVSQQPLFCRGLVDNRIRNMQTRSNAGKNDM